MHRIPPLDRLAAAALALAATWSLPACGADPARAAAEPAADLVVLDARVTTQDDARPQAQAFAVRDGAFVAVGTDGEIAPLAGEDTLVVRAGGRRVVPGLVDSHLHAVRGGRFYALELRWDGVPSLERGLAMIQEQARRTPPGQWVRVVGGWSPYQFSERRMPTVAELNAASPDVPVFVLFLYSRGFLNAAGARALGIGADTVAPQGGRYELTDGGAILHAEPSPAILYGTVAQLPQLASDEQILSTRHFFRELARFGLTGALDAGGGGHAYPADYAASATLAAERALPLRISSWLFAQEKGRELADYERWTGAEELDLGAPSARPELVVEGAGENLVWSAGDFENFLAPRPELDARMEEELGAVARLLATRGWPIRIHATYDESIGRILDVLAPIFAETGYRARWCIDHAETISPQNVERIRALGGGIAVQNRMAFAGEHFAERYGAEAARHAPPLRRLLDAGLPVAAGTDATRVSSYDPWLALDWLVTGRTVGGTPLAAPENRLSRAEALRLFTLGSAWLANAESVQGRIAPGQLADFAILSEDFFAVAEERIRAIESVLTVAGGEVTWAAEPFASVAPEPLPPIGPAWSPVARFGGIQR